MLALLGRCCTPSSSSRLASFYRHSPGHRRCLLSGSHPASAPFMASSLAAPTIQLDPAEERVLDLIHSFTEHLKTNRSDLPVVECRVAGGWVRDKLLGLPCDDLDICISTLTGHHFATLLEEYLATLKTNDPLITSTKIAKIQANPDQSKHLETAKMHVLDLEMDFVQLRSEEYADGQGSSRIPTSVKFGTPLEDALRRDITINTLFYNIHSRKVEDWTEKGFSDLLSASPLIRTPLEPLQTFLDDPLRILRCVRFASRFGFPLKDDIKPAVQDERVRHALLTKVSKERIGVELDKMLKGPNPLLGLELLDTLALYDLIFSPLPTIQPSASIPQSASRDAIHIGTIVHSLLNPSSSSIGDSDTLNKLLSPAQDKLVRKRLWLAIALAPLRDLTYMEKKKQTPLTETIVKDSVKLPNAEKAFVSHIHAAYPKLSYPELSKFTSDGVEKEQSRVGLMLRDTDVHDPTNGLEWRTSVLFAMLLDLAPVWSDAMEVQAVIHRYIKFVDRIEELKLDVRAFEKSRLDGNEVTAVLQAKPGRLMSVIISRIVEWQLDHPDASKEECGEWIKNEWEEGRITLPASDGADAKNAQQQQKAKTEGKPAKKKRKESI